VVNADLILVMQDGHLVEHGTHTLLLARGGAYATLVGAQVKTSAEQTSPRRTTPRTMSAEH
jgi:ABC-type transport system involved in cytochrome bd biosynthesis fused ATPase/permease subunit